MVKHLWGGQLSPLAFLICSCSLAQEQNTLLIRPSVQPIPSATPTPLSYWQNLNGAWSSPTPKPTSLTQATSSPSPLTASPSASPPQAAAVPFIVMPKLKSGTSNLIISPVPLVTSSEEKQGYFEGWVGYDDKSSSWRCQAKDSSADLNALREAKTQTPVQCTSGTTSLMCETRWASAGSKSLGKQITYIYDITSCGQTPGASPADLNAFLKEYNRGRECIITVGLAREYLEGKLSLKDPKADLEARHHEACLEVLPDT